MTSPALSEEPSTWRPSATAVAVGLVIAALVLVIPVRTSDFLDHGTWACGSVVVPVHRDEREPASRPQQFRVGANDLSCRNNRSIARVGAILVAVAGVIAAVALRGRRWFRWLLLTAAGCVAGFALLIVADVLMSP